VTFTYKFSSGASPAYCGRFANGDYWIAPQAGQSLSITSITQAGGLKVAAELDPYDYNTTGLLGATYNYGNYVASKNIVSQLPLSISKTGNHLIVSAIERNQPVEGNCGTSSILNGCIDAYNFLTALPQVPANLGKDLLRPSVSGGLDKLYSLSDFNFNRLPQVAGLKAKTTDDLEIIRARWAATFELNFKYSEGGRAFRAHLVQDDYGSGESVSWHDDFATILNSSLTLDQKKAALASLLTFGKDHYFIFQSPLGPKAPMGGGAGQSQGRYPPIVLFASLVRNPEIAASLASIPAQPYHTGTDPILKPTELEQIRVGSNGLLWGDVPAEGEKRYWSDLFKAQCFAGAKGTCAANLGKKTSMDPYFYVDGPAENPGDYYAGIGGGAILNIASEAWLMPVMCDVMGTDLFYKYVDQKMSDGVRVTNDPCAPPDPRESSTCAPYYDGTATPTNCLYYKLTWGPNPAKPGTCIQNAAGQSGRYSNLVGKVAKWSYYAPDFAPTKYATYKGSRTSCLSKPAGVTLVKTAATYNATTKLITWSNPVLWSDGTAFDSSKYLGWYKVTYVSLSGLQTVEILQTTSFDASKASSLTSVKLEVCDHLNRCQAMTVN